MRWPVPPPEICFEASAPPTAAREPAACREPADEIEARLPRLPAPGEAKRDDRVSGALGAVIKPAAMSAETSVGVNPLPDIIVEVGLAFISDTYLARNRKREYHRLMLRFNDVQCSQAFTWMK